MSTFLVKSKPGLTLWRTWLDAVNYYAEHYGKIMEVLDALDSTDSSAVAAVKSLPSEQLLEDILFIDSNFKIVSKTIILLESSKLQLSEALNIVNKVSQTLIQNNNSLISEKAVSEVVLLTFRDDGEGLMYQFENNTCYCDNTVGGRFDPALWIEFGLAQWSERLIPPYCTVAVGKQRETVTENRRTHCTPLEKYIYTTHATRALQGRDLSGEPFLILRYVSTNSIVRRKRKMTYCSTYLVIIDAITNVAVNDDIFSILSSLIHKMSFPYFLIALRISERIERFAVDIMNGSARHYSTRTKYLSRITQLHTLRCNVTMNGQGFLRIVRCCTRQVHKRRTARHVPYTLIRNNFLKSSRIRVCQLYWFEYADIVYVYGLCDGSSLRTVAEYERRFPNRRVPDRRVFTVYGV
ncbi:hypothetical protein ANN_26667 [Periplaneta americana]|uniref:DUF4817 domain-containing protein n=1 Tax=Periplaneta americana TaxID=6978 RepID=A0ABQ8RYP5_PERAM|nr:hypothetical protein ANN_26667 [Periplaneta americana]